MKTHLVVALAVAVVAVMACTGDALGPGITANPVEEAGTYTLVTVNDGPLPAVVLQLETLKGEIVSDVVVVGADSTFTETRQSRITSNGEVSNTQGTTSGTWSVSAGVATFTVPGASPPTFTGSFSATGLTATVQGNVLKYTQG